MGDFNEVIFQEEYFGSNIRPFKQMEDFRLALSDCGLMDIGFEGSKFTWCNKREGIEFTKCRLDKALSNVEWLNLFDSNQVLVLPVQCSDHNPLSIHFSNSAQDESSIHRIFRYEVAWGKREWCTELIKATWIHKPHQASKLDDTRGILKACRDKLKIWSKEAFRQQKRLLNYKREQLRILQESNAGQFNSQINVLQNEIDGYLEEEDLKWRQRAKQRWLKDGDRNTKYFHKCASQRKQMNRIKHIKNGNGIVTFNKDEIARTFQEYYQSLFSSSKPSNIEAALNNFPPSVTTEMNCSIASRFSE
ncbi:uncharacterized protein LOC121249346 [Juglans microcarpa x Juglans regia]|uniref:uncharacterized protein LOC121249346 n=1 Tax=Juglans microcarpa x Juglans regia TaxID=2249226 RepID=UPI001B7E0C10|nr:uncharacterized protein LOC121249346 [Juglans microcarpa x Juglans regia]